MSFQVGRAVAAQRGATARLRGAAAGTTSGAISVAAHGWASGGMAPDGTTFALLTAAAAVIGALVAGLAPLRDTSVGLVAALVGGQLLGHLTMGFSSGHMHHGDAQLTPAMLTAHLVAAVVAAVLIRGAEAAYRIGCAVLSRVLPLRYHPPAVIGPASLRSAHRDRVILRIFAAETLRTRGPPISVRL
ncbi:hypothetical protein [Nocardia arthritidis]|uniref:Uncharacterized protein n=1 Tax=Nocardia arthritidis TaxID=228602 RepID=A0A6G9YP52_9NOCA|nr:hypothetical protein [Nocardia arthritidis]QIS15075.1 hypothetical protein F5544_36230 [Nocardia arthritidis]